jgi:hypothetical protein
MADFMALVIAIRASEEAFAIVRCSASALLLFGGCAGQSLLRTDGWGCDAA